MSGLEAIWLGLVQGLTEFFPVSSSGHLVLFQSLIGVGSEGGLLFEIGVHVATLFAILAYYRQRIAELIRGTLSADPESLVYVAQLGVATLPAVAVGAFCSGCGRKHLCASGLGRSGPDRDRVHFYGRRVGLSRERTGSVRVGASPWVSV